MRDALVVAPLNRVDERDERNAGELLVALVRPLHRDVVEQVPAATVFEDDEDVARVLHRVDEAHDTPLFGDSAVQLDLAADALHAVVIAALLADDFDGPVDGVGRILGVDFDGLVDDAEAASTEELGEQVPPIELEAEEARHEIGGGGRHGCSGKKMCRRCVDTNELQARGEKGCKVEEMRRTGERLKVVHLERRKDGMGILGA